MAKGSKNGKKGSKAAAASKTAAPEPTDMKVGKAAESGQEQAPLAFATPFPWTATSLMALVVVTGLSLLTRLWKVEFPPKVLFDEVHFVGFAQQYAAGRPIFDIHPPLGKLWLALIVHLSGFHTNVPYKDIGKAYEDDGYRYMRYSQCLWGATLAPLAFLSLRQMGVSLSCALFGGLLVVLELSLQTISRAVFMDAHLYGSIAFAFYSALCALRETRGGVRFWLWTTLTGLWMGSAFSIKHTGLGVIGTVGSLHLLKTLYLVAAPPAGSPEAVRAHTRFVGGVSAAVAFAAAAVTVAAVEDKALAVAGGLVGGTLAALGAGLVSGRPEFVRNLLAGVWMLVLVALVYITSFVIHFKLGGERMRQGHGMIWNIMNLNERMYLNNQASVFNHYHGSQWWEWPFLYRGLVYWWEDQAVGATHTCVYLFGNPFIYWGVCVSVVVAAWVLDKKVWMLFSEGVKLPASTAPVFLCLYAWTANYLPYPLIVKRTCFMYHYHPSLYYGIMLLASLVDLTTQNNRRRRMLIIVSFLALCAATYRYYLPFSYAWPITQEYHEQMRKMHFFPVLRKIFPIW